MHYRIGNRAIGAEKPTAAKPILKPGSTASAGVRAHLTFLHRCFQPDGATEISPTFQRWGNGPPDVLKSRQGRQNRGFGGRAALPSLTGLAPPARPQPSVETLGYYLPPCGTEGELATN